MAFQEWEIAEAETSSVLLCTLIAARYSYPWTLAVSARYSLDADTGLTVELSATNIGEGTAPYGVGFHPYLAVDGVPADELELENPASIIYEADDSMIPVDVYKRQDQFSDTKRSTRASSSVFSSSEIHAISMELRAMRSRSARLRSKRSANAR